MSELAVISGEVMPEASPTELAAIANREHRLAFQSGASMVEHAIRAGEALEAAKDRVQHGEWLSWLGANFEGSRQTADNYRHLAANCRRVSNLEEPSLRKALAAIAGPTQRAEIGEPNLAEPAGPRALGQQSRLVAGAAEKAQRLVEIAPHFDFDVIRQLPEEEKEQWKQQLSSARTALSRLIAAL